MFSAESCEMNVRNAVYSSCVNVLDDLYTGGGKSLNVFI